MHDSLTKVPGNTLIISLRNRAFYIILFTELDTIVYFSILRTIIISGETSKATRL